MTTSYKANTTEQLSLVFELYQRIPQGRKVTAKQLQTELADTGIYRSIRSIQRNLDIIINYFDVDKDTRNKPFGYSRRMHNPIILGTRELLLLQLAKSVISQQLPSSLEYAIESAFSLILTQPRSHTGTKPPKDGATKTYAILDSFHSAHSLDTLFEPLSIALIHQRQVTITLDSNILLEQISPLGITVVYGELYLVYQNTINQYHDLPLKQVSQLKVLTFHFDYPDNFQLQDYYEKE